MTTDLTAEYTAASVVHETSGQFFRMLKRNAEVLHEGPYQIKIIEVEDPNNHPGETVYTVELTAEPEGSGSIFVGKVHGLKAKTLTTINAESYEELLFLAVNWMAKHCSAANKK